MNQLIEAIDRIDRLRLPSDLSFYRDGSSIAAAVRPATREPNESFQSRVWRFRLAGTAEQLTHGPNGDGLPRWSPVDDRIAFVSDRAVKDKMALFILDRGAARPLGDIPGTIEELRWTADGKALVALAADRGLDGASANGARRLSWDEPDDPAVTNPTPRRRLFHVSAADGTTTEVGPADLSVWEFDLLGSDGAVAIASDDASERGWYHARLVRIDFATLSVATVHETRWQLQSPAVSPDGKRVAFLDGWSSDRGAVASAIHILDLGEGTVTTLDAGQAQDVVTHQWRDNDRLWFAGWSKLGTVYGVIRADGTLVWSKREDATIGSGLANVSPAPDKTGFAAVREAVGKPPEIVFKLNAEADWRPVTRLNGEVGEGFPGYPEVRAVAWEGAGGLALEGLLLVPPERPPGPLPMIVDIHGGPSWAAHFAFNPGHTVPFAAAGYAVFLANYRGNSGWGQDIAKLNIGDPGGAEFDDILAGIDWCVAEKIADPDRLGVTGVSYGGYMTAWAVATTSRFRAAVMVSGISNHWSCHYSCGNDFCEFMVGGPLREERFRQIALDRSPLMRLDRPTTPTLILHGAEDRCTPLGQGQEFYSALREHGCTAELVVYPREGHGLRERRHRRDAWVRTIAWFERFLRP